MTRRTFLQALLAGLATPFALQASATVATAAPAVGAVPDGFFYFSTLSDPDRWDGTPALRCGLAPTTRLDYLGIDRSQYPPLKE